MTTPALTLYHNPRSRSASARVLLEALGVPYEVKLVDFAAGQTRTPEFLAINPLGKLPTLVHDGAVVTEQVAITIYLADRFPAAGLAPAFDHPQRGPYLRWLAFYAACFEPALMDHAFKRAPIDPATAPWRDYDTVIETLVAQLSRADYLVGDTLTAADLLWGTGLRWTTEFGIVPKLPVIVAYLERVAAYPAVIRAASLDAALTAQIDPPAAP
ncbi:MAG: glutathione S-transferase family protein [Arenimonas sp.]|uniref:glutathione S-transferase family protein n=1 Tax=Arenimonas sp. TaxID=1872635 RepID=UPI0025C49A4E|nr:glutathione S-transferase family protein [Arenimonas sp.]MBW8369029.1 glutathione S-transferase family protein [Arenimonas sp.]